MDSDHIHSVSEGQTYFSIAFPPHFPPLPPLHSSGINKRMLLKADRSGNLVKSFLSGRPKSIVFSFFVLFVYFYKAQLLIFNLVQFSSSVVSNSLQPHGLQHARTPYPSPTPRDCSNSCPSSWWCHLTISYSVVLLSACLQSFPTSGSFPMSQLFTSVSQTIGVSALASILPMNIQDWFPLGLTGLISLQSKGLSRVFSNTTVQKHQFFDT